MIPLETPSSREHALTDPCTWRKEPGSAWQVRLSLRACLPDEGGSSEISVRQVPPDTYEHRGPSSLGDCQVRVGMGEDFVGQVLEKEGLLRTMSVSVHFRALTGQEKPMVQFATRWDKDPVDVLRVISTGSLADEVEQRGERQGEEGCKCEPARSGLRRCVSLRPPGRRRAR